MEILEGGNGTQPPKQTEKQQLICPILTGAVTTAMGLLTNMSMQERLAGSGLTVPRGPQPVQISGVPCVAEKCGFWHHDTGMCGIAAGAHILNVVGGHMLEKFIPEVVEKKPKIEKKSEMEKKSES